MLFKMLKVETIALVLWLSCGASASTIPDLPVAVIEPGLEVDDRLGAEMGWVDDYTLLATAQIDSKSQFWERKVMRVDVRTGQTGELFRQGALICANPTEKIAGVLVGSEASIYTGNSKEPKPELNFYSWNSLLGKLSPKSPGVEWNFFICKKTKQADTKVPAIGFLQREIRYLEAKDGYLSLSMDQRVVLVKNERPVATLDAKSSEVAPVPQYLPFRDEYLLSSGRFVMTGSMARPNEAHVTEYPLLTMTSAGRVKREYFRKLFESNGLGVDGMTFPYAKGTVIIVSDRPKNGGGIYLNQGGSIKRIWCTSNGSEYDRQCRPVSISMSPDGCHLALFAKGSDNLKSPYAYGPTLKILPLCK